MPNKHIELDNLYIWSSLALPLALRNNLHHLFLEQKSIQLAQLFTTIYYKAVKQSIPTRSPQQPHVELNLHCLAALQPVSPLFLTQIQGKDELEWA